MCKQHFGEEIYVTRKGAVSARAGQYGIIPGSMGAKSFIVRGLEMKSRLFVQPTRAGRVMSRTKAKNCSAWKIKSVPPRMWNAVKMPKRFQVELPDGV